MAYSDEPGTAGLCRLLVEQDERIYLRVSGIAEPVEIDHEAVDRTMLELENRSRLVRHLSIGLGLVGVIVALMRLLQNATVAQVTDGMIKYCAAAFVAMMVAAAWYAQAPTRGLVRRTRENHWKARTIPVPRFGGDGGAS